MASWLDGGAAAGALLRGMSAQDYCAAAGGACSQEEGAEGALALVDEVKDLHATVSALLSCPSSFGQDVTTYYQYYDSLGSVNFVSKQDLAKVFTDPTSGEFDPDALRTYMTTFKVHMDRLAPRVSALSDHLTSLPALSLDASSAFRTVLALHMLRVRLSYQPGISQLAATRKPGVPFGIWTIYWLPYVKDVFTKRIPATWEAFPKRIESWMLAGINWWAELGETLALMPCNMAYTDPAERARRCKMIGENFTQRKETLAARTPYSSVEDSDVVEHASLASALGGIVSLFRSIGPICAAIGEQFKKFTSDPFGTILWFLMLIIGTIVGIILMIWYTLMTFLGSFWIILVVVVVVGAFLWSWWYTLFLLLIVWLVSIPYFLLWLVDMPTGGLVCRLMRCENLPDAWYTTPNWAEGSMYARTDALGSLVCSSPCSASYTPWGPLATRRERYLPAFCPQQQLFRVLQGAGLASPAALTTYPPPPGFASLNVSTKQSMIVSCFKRKMAWYQSCYGAFQQYDYINRFACANVDALGLSNEDAAQVRTLCLECYCRYAPGSFSAFKGASAHMTAPGAPGPSFCAALAAGEMGGDPSGGGEATALLVHTALLAVLLITLLALMYSMLLAAALAARPA
jgi:hypothetical protein